EPGDGETETPGDGNEGEDTEEPEDGEDGEDTEEPGDGDNGEDVEEPGDGETETPGDGNTIDTELELVDSAEDSTEQGAVPTLQVVGFQLDTFNAGQDEDAEQDIFQADQTNDVTGDYQDFFGNNQDDGFVSEEDLDGTAEAKADAPALAETGAGSMTLLAGAMVLSLAGAGAVYAHQRRSGQNS